ncbi:MAG TPA: hypothetical protein VNC50_16380 [Planctomycetia bacterium]|nr:hypothetical protein [Planctomycetia bacterium]
MERINKASAMAAVSLAAALVAAEPAAAQVNIGLNAYGPRGGVSIGTGGYGYGPGYGYSPYLGGYRGYYGPGYGYSRYLGGYLGNYGPGYGYNYGYRPAYGPYYSGYYAPRYSATASYYSGYSGGCGGHATAGYVAPSYRNAPAGYFGPGYAVTTVTPRILAEPRVVDRRYPDPLYADVRIVEPEVGTRAGVSSNYASLAYAAFPVTGARIVEPAFNGPTYAPKSGTVAAYPPGTR